MLPTQIQRRTFTRDYSAPRSFDNLAARYAFGVAAFDNAQVRHATADDVLFMVFK